MRVLTQSKALCASATILAMFVYTAAPNYGRWYAQPTKFDATKFYQQLDRESGAQGGA